METLLAPNELLAGAISFEAAAPAVRPPSVPTCLRCRRGRRSFRARLRRRDLWIHRPLADRIEGSAPEEPEFFHDIDLAGESVAPASASSEGDHVPGTDRHDDNDIAPSIVN